MLASQVPPKWSDIRGQAITVVIGLLVAILLWYSSYVGWFVSGNPVASFQVETVSRDKALTWSQLNTKYPKMFSSNQFLPRQVSVNVSAQYWEKVLYPKNLFFLHIVLKNSQKATFWHLSILVFLVDSSSDYVRGKHLFQLTSQDDGVKGEASTEYVSYCEVPDDLKGQSLIVKVFLYGEFVGGSLQSLSTSEDDIYGTIPGDHQSNWSIDKTESQYHTFPSLIPYLLQGGSIATNALFIISLVTMVHVREKIKSPRLARFGFYLALIILMLIIFAAAFLMSLLLA